MTVKKDNKLNIKQESKEKALKNREKESDKPENSDEQDRKGVIPENLDFRKFIGCGG